MVPTIGFNLLSVLVIVRLARRELVWINVTVSITTVSDGEIRDCSCFLCQEN